LDTIETPKCQLPQPLGALSFFQKRIRAKLIIMTKIPKSDHFSNVAKLIARVRVDL